MKHWYDISPAEAVGIQLPHPDFHPGPMNELGETCPWPWDPEQLVGAPLGQYHCPYCGGMQVAGVPHLDLTGVCLACFGHSDPGEHPCFQCGGYSCIDCGDILSGPGGTHSLHSGSVTCEGSQTKLHRMEPAKETPDVPEHNARSGDGT